MFASIGPIIIVCQVDYFTQPGRGWLDACINENAMKYKVEADTNYRIFHRWITDFVKVYFAIMFPQVQYLTPTGKRWFGYWINENSIQRKVDTTYRIFHLWIATFAESFLVAVLLSSLFESSLKRLVGLLYWWKLKSTLSRYHLLNISLFYATFEKAFFFGIYF